ATRGGKARERAGGALYTRGDGLFGRLQHGIVIPGAVVPETIDEDGGRSRDPVAPSTPLIGFNPALDLVALEILDKAIHIDAKRTDMVQNFVFVRGRRIVEQPIVHIPEAALARRRFGRSSNEGRDGMDFL